MSGGPKILHVDDSPGIGELTSQLLGSQETRLEVTNASSGEEGLRLLDANEFDCVISDSVRLADGRLFASAVRERDARLPIVLFSSKSSRELLEEMQSTGANEVVQKSGVESFERLERVVLDSVLLAADGWELLAHHDWSGSQELVTTIAVALEEFDGLPPTEGVPLFETVDADALSEVLAPTADGTPRESVSVRFVYRDLVFALFGDGRVLVRPES